MFWAQRGLADRATDRRVYGERMEGRAREGMEEETLQRLRRGWLLGGKGFRDRVLDWMEQRNAAAGQKRKIRREETDADHGQRQAERIIQKMMGELGLTEAELKSTRKSDWRKRAIAQRLRQETSVSLLWLGRRLAMGSEGHVSRLSSNVDDLAKHPGWRAFRKTQTTARKKD